MGLVNVCGRSRAKFGAQPEPDGLRGSNVKNLPFYRRHGFEVIDELQLVMNGPTMWLMWRPATY